jgi:hypothetical protein
VLTFLAEGETAVQLPMPAAAYGITAIVIFAVLLGITFGFRGMAHRHAPITHPDEH